MVSKIEPDRYADTVFFIADTPADLNKHLFDRMMEKTGAERLAIGCRMTDTAREIVWSGIPRDLPIPKRRELFLQRFYGEKLSTAHCSLGAPYEEAVANAQAWELKPKPRCKKESFRGV